MSVALLGSLWRPGLPPGIYEEKPAVASRPRVRLDVAALIGLAERGPVNTPVRIDDARQFEAVFGRAVPGLKLPLAVRLFFANGGRRCVVVRCVDHVNIRTTRLLLPGLKAVRGNSRKQVRLAARNPGSWGNRLQLRCQLIQRPVALGVDPVTKALRIPPDRPAVGATLRLTRRASGPGATPRSRFFRVDLDATRQPILVPTPTAPFLDPELLAAAVELTLRVDVFLDDTLVESWDDTALHPSHPRFLPRLLGRRAASEALLPPRTDTPNPEDPAAEADRRWGSADAPWGSDFLRPSLQLADAWLLPGRELFAAPAGLLLSAAEMPPSRQGRDASASTGRNHFFEGTSMALADAIEDADHRFALYAQRSQGGTDTPAHDHTTWAIIVGVDGDELNRLYVHEAGGVRKTGEQVVGRGTGIAFMPDDLHSIHIPPQTPVLNFHMYGLALEQLHGRRYYRPATHDWAHFPASEGIRDLPAPAARSGA